MRFLAALGMGGEWALGVALVMECWPSKYRPLLAGFIGAASNVGFLLIALVGLTFAELGQSWRLMMIAGAAPAILTVFIQALVPESAAWKETKQAHRIGPDPLVEVFGPSLRGKTLVAVALGGVALLGTWGSVQWIPTWVREELLAHEPTSRAKAVGAYMSQIASALGAIVGCFVGPWLGHRFGRRPVYFGLCVASLIVCQLTFLNFKEYGWPLLGMVLLAGMTTASFYGWLPLYLPELFPTRVRATGQGFAFNGGRVLAALGVIFTGQLVASMGYSRAGAVISGVYIVGMLAVWLAPETKGKPMPE
jgi:MFS family permease